MMPTKTTTKRRTPALDRPVDVIEEDLDAVIETLTDQAALTDDPDIKAALRRAVRERDDVQDADRRVAERKRGLRQREIEAAKARAAQEKRDQVAALREEGRTLCHQAETRWLTEALIDVAACARLVEIGRALYSDDPVTRYLRWPQDIAVWNLIRLASRIGDIGVPTVIARPDRANTLGQWLGFDAASAKFPPPEEN
jgi:hypothetical protein